MMSALVTVLYTIAGVLFAIAAVGLGWIIVDEVRVRRNRRMMNRILQAGAAGAMAESDAFEAHAKYHSD